MGPSASNDLDALDGALVPDSAVRAYLDSNPGNREKQIREAMDTFGVSPEQMARVTGFSPEEVRKLYNAAGPATGTGVVFDDIDLPGTLGGTPGFPAFGSPGFPLLPGQGTAPPPVQRPDTNTNTNINTNVINNTTGQPASSANNTNITAAPPVAPAPVAPAPVAPAPVAPAPVAPAPVAPAPVAPAPVAPAPVAPIPVAPTIPVTLARGPAEFNAGVMQPRPSAPSAPLAPVAPGDFAIPNFLGGTLRPPGPNAFEDEVVRRRALGLDRPDGNFIRADSSTSAAGPSGVIQPGPQGRLRSSGGLDPYTLGSYKQLSNAFGTTTDRAGNVTAGATLPTADAIRRGQLTAQIAGQNAQLSDVLGTKVDRLGNVIAAPAMPSFFKDGGEVTGGSPSLDEYLKQQMGESQDPSAALFDNAQKLMANFNEVPKVEPMRRVVKRVSRGAGSDSKTDKNMSIKVPPLAASKGMAFNLPSAQEAAEAKSMGTAREQMEELARVYQLKINAAKNKARGLGADTFGAPTLEGPTLVKKSLTKQRFAEGGFVSVLEKGDMSSPAYRAQLEREQGLEGSYPEMIVAPLVKSAAGAARAGLDRLLASRASEKFTDLDNARRNAAFMTLTEKEKAKYFGTGQLPDDYAQRMKNASAIGAEVGKAPFPIAVPGPKEKRANLKEYLGKTVRDPSARRLLVELEAQSRQEETQK